MPKEKWLYGAYDVYVDEDTGIKMAAIPEKDFLDLLMECEKRRDERYDRLEETVKELIWGNATQFGFEELGDKWRGATVLQMKLQAEIQDGGIWGKNEGDNNDD